MSMFSLQAFHNEYLPAGGRDVDVIITVTADRAGGGGPAPAGPPATSEIIMVDVSGSMRGVRIAEAIRSTVAAISCLRDGVRFAILAGNHKCEVIFPPQGRSTATASPQTRKEAEHAVRKLRAGGGTAMGRWIQTAADMLGQQPGVRHAILLTDGRNESEEPADLAAALDRAAGTFQCDCRGVGADWEVSELRRIADALLGTVDIVADPAHLAADFEAMMRQAMGKQVADAKLRIWNPAGSQIGFVKQVAPVLQDLTATRVPVNDLTGDYLTGSWGAESRDYHLSVRVPAGSTGDEMLAARVSVIVEDQPVSQCLVRVSWTEDTVLSTRINRQVAHYTGQQELAEAIQDGLEARRNGDPDTARVKLGRAVQLAHDSANEDMAALLANVVDVDDAATGRVRLKSQVSNEAEMTLDTRSTKTVRVRK